jgi:hypothetical protein
MPPHKVAASAPPARNAFEIVMPCALISHLLGRREHEHRVLDRHVRFDLLDRRLLAIAVGLAFAGDREREIHAVDLFVVAVVLDGFHLRAAHRALRHPADLEPVIRIEVEILDVAVLARHLELVRIGAVDVLGAEVFELAAGRLPVEQRTADRRVVGERARIVGRHLFRILAALERRDLPRLVAVPRLHRRESLQADFGAARLGRLAIRHEGQLELAAEHELAARLQRLDRLQFRGAAACFQVLRDQLIHADRLRRRWPTPARRGRTATAYPC